MVCTSSCGILVFWLNGLSSADCAFNGKKDDEEGGGSKSGASGKDSGSNNNDLVEKLINQYGPLLQKLGFGGIMGVCSGVALRKVGHEAAGMSCTEFIVLESILLYLTKLYLTCQSVLD